jgi:hypothetical protein
MLARKRKKKSRRQLTEWKKNPLNKNQEWEPIHLTYKAMRTQADTTQRKNKSKQSTKIKNQVKTYAKSTHWYKMTINNNKEDLKQKSYHLSQIDKSTYTNR